MKKRGIKKEQLAILILTLIVFTTLVIYLRPESTGLSTFETQAACGNPANGSDWYITNDQVCQDQVITLFNTTSVQVKGNLTLQNVTLIMNVTANGSVGIHVHP